MSDPLQFPGFDFQPRTRLVFGANTADTIGALARECGIRRALVVTDPGIVKAGHVDRIEAALMHAGVTFTRFDRVHENPTTRDVADCLAVARAAGIDGLIGLGGGSSMDTAKGCNFILTNGGRMQDYWGVGKASKPMLPLIAIPTTAGTGSECQSFALIADENTHLKMACGDAKAAPRVAILDPTLTVSQPRSVTAHTGIDALTHAVETAVTNRRTPLSSMFALEAFRLIVPALPRVLAEPADLNARGQMLLGAAWAGTAIENSMLGAAHSLANPLTAHFNIVHGEAVGLMLPAVIRYNSVEPTAQRAYADLARIIGLHPEGPGPEQGAAALLATVKGLLDAAGVPPSLAAAGVDPARLGELAGEAAKQWTAQFNPRRVDEVALRVLYEESFAPRTRA